MNELLDAQDKLSQVNLLLYSLRDTCIMFEDNKSGYVPVTICTILEMSIEKCAEMINEASAILESKRTAGSRKADDSISLSSDCR